MEFKSQLIRYWLPVQSLFVLVLTVLCGVWLAQITWFFMSDPVVVKAERIQPANKPASESGTNWLQVSRDIAQREFFGEVVVEQAEVVEAVEAPDTSLSFTLQAVMAQGEGTGFAVIGERNATGKVFGIGDDLFGKAELSAVYGDRVIIDRRGELETLRYEKIESGALVRSVQQDNGSDSTGRSADTFQEALVQANAEVASGGDLETQVQGMVDYVTRRANEDPEAFVQEMGLQPTDGGYQVTRRARQLQMVGLRPGDVVTSVNDMQVGNIQSDQALLNQVLQTGGEIKIQIRRGSRSFTIYQSIPSY
jgi:general secretion pathway protein C